MFASFTKLFFKIWIELEVLLTLQAGSLRTNGRGCNFNSQYPLNFGQRAVNLMVKGSAFLVVVGLLLIVKNRL